MSRRRGIWSWALVVLMLGLVAGAAYYVLLPQLQPHTTLHLGDAAFVTRVANTDTTRSQGLAGTTELREDQAMLLVYDSDSKWAVTMKDMKYPIDIVWLDKDKKVVYIVKNASPDSYPYDQFAPKQDARYVVELPQGTVGKKTIAIGASATFDENNLEGWSL